MADRYGFTTISTELEDRILVVKFNRPDRLNALNKVMHDELAELYGRIERDPDVDVVVLTGDIHAGGAADLRSPDAGRDGPVVAAELVGTSISSPTLAVLYCPPLRALASLDASPSVTVCSNSLALSWSDL